MAVGEQGVPLPIVHKTSSPTLPFADAVTMARVLGTLESRGKKVVIRQEGASSFSELEPAVSVNYCGSFFGTEYVDTSSTSGQRLTGRSDGDSLAFRTGSPRICSADADQHAADMSDCAAISDVAVGHKFSPDLAHAKSSDITLAFLGLSPELEGEEMPIRVDGFDGGDRTRIELPEVQQQLVTALAARGRPLVIVLMNGSAWHLRTLPQKASAILEAWYPGEAGGTAIADTLLGDSNPSGRLPLPFTQQPSNCRPSRNTTTNNDDREYWGNWNYWADFAANQGAVVYYATPVGSIPATNDLSKWNYVHWGTSLNPGLYAGIYNASDDTRHGCNYAIPSYVASFPNASRTNGVATPAPPWQVYFATPTDKSSYALGYAQLSISAACAYESYVVTLDGHQLIWHYTNYSDCAIRSGLSGYTQWFVMEFSASCPNQTPGRSNEITVSMSQTNGAEDDAWWLELTNNTSTLRPPAGTTTPTYHHPQPRLVTIPSPTRNGRV